MISLVLAALLQEPAAASAPPEPPRGNTVASPDWLRRPAPDAFMRYYPEAARKADLTGRATIKCTVTERGDLADCEVASEDPSRLGFGHSALQVSPFFKMRPMSRNGKLVGGATIKIPMHFTIPADVRAGAVIIPKTEFKGVSVEVNCRYQGQKADNCYADQYPAPPAAATTAALVFAEGTNLPPMPRPSGRIVVPIMFVAAAGAPPAPDDPVGNPVWVRRPSGAEFARLFPNAAQSRDISGRTVSQCVVTAEGALTACQSVLEDPPGLGFAEAALQLMVLFKMQPTDGGGGPVAGHTIKIPVRWILPH